MQSPAPLEFLSSPYITSIPPIHYDSKGRQTQYVETSIQRHERVAFLRKREWARRVSAWIEHSESVSEDYRRDVLYDSAMVHRSVPNSKQDPHSDMSSVHSQSTQTARPKVTWDISVPEYDDNEPYIFYSSSSSTSSPSSSSSGLGDELSSPSTSPTRQHLHPYPMAKTHRRQRSSLSSINEEPEEI